MAPVGIPLLLPSAAAPLSWHFQFAEIQDVSSRAVPSLGLDRSLFALKIVITNQEMAGWKLHYEKYAIHIPGTSLHYNALHC